MKSSGFLKGHHIALRSVEETDIPDIAKWMNNPEVTHFMFDGQRPTNLAQVRELILSQINSPNNVVFVVATLDQNKPIGFCGLYDIQLTAQKAEFRILIGEPSFWGRGVGTEITRLVTFYGFDRLNLHRIWLGVTSENIGAIKTYHRVGYEDEGVLKDDIYRNGRYYDTLRMGMLRNRYDQCYRDEDLKRFSEKGGAE